MFTLIFLQGRTFQSQIESHIARNSHLNNVLLQKYTSHKVRRIYENVLKNVEQTYPQYIDELRGIAAGSKVSFFKVSYSDFCRHKEMKMSCLSSCFCCILMKSYLVLVVKNLMVDFWDPLLSFVTKKQK